MAKKKTGAHSEFYTLSAAVYSVLEDLQESEARFNQFLKYAIDGARKFQFSMMHEIHFEEIEMKPWKQIDLPCDMVDWTKIGFRCGNQIKMFTHDSNISKIFDTKDCIPIESVPCKQEISFVGNNDFFCNTGFHYYGAVVNYNHAGYFDVDWHSRVINFKNTVQKASTVYLEFITDGVNYSGQTVIHPLAFKALQDYIHWQRKEHDDRYSGGDKQRAKSLFEESFQECLVNNLNISIQDIQEALRKGFKQTIKN